jgi:hypothetical protein
VRGAVVVKYSTAQAGKGEVGFAGNDVVGKAADGLLVGFVADFGAADDDDQVGTEAFEEGDEVSGWGGVPDIDAEADDFGLLGEDGFGDVEEALVDVEFKETGARLEVAEVGEQVAQAESAVRVPGVEGGQDDVGHGATS